MTEAARKTSDPAGSPRWLRRLPCGLVPRSSNVSFGAIDKRNLPVAGEGNPQFFVARLRSGWFRNLFRYALHNVAWRQKLGIAFPATGKLRLSMAPKETFEGSGTSRKAGAGASEAIRLGHLFFLAASVIDPLHEPLVFARGRGTARTERLLLEQRLPVLADHAGCSTTRSRPSSARSGRASR